MAIQMQYNKVLKYYIEARLSGPLHIGSSFGDKNQILVHPVSGEPFIQASSLSGVLRSYCDKKYPEQTDCLFGTQEENSGSRIRIT